MEYEVEGPRPRGRPGSTWREVVEKDCQARKLNKEDRRRKLIMDVWWTGWVCVGECFFWYRPTRVVPDKGPLNGCVCVIYFFYNTVCLTGTGTETRRYVLDNNVEQQCRTACQWDGPVSRLSPVGLLLLHTPTCKQQELCLSPFSQSRFCTFTRASVECSHCQTSFFCPVLHYMHATQTAKLWLLITVSDVIVK